MPMHTQEKIKWYLVQRKWQPPMPGPPACLYETRSESLVKAERPAAAGAGRGGGGGESLYPFPNQKGESK